MRKLAARRLPATGIAIVAGIALTSGCQKQVELASEAKGVYERGVEPKLPPPSVTLESVPDVAPPPEDAPIDGTPAASAAPPAADGAAGIDPSADPLLETRADVYLMSGRRRRAAGEKPPEPEQ